MKKQKLLLLMLSLLLTTTSFIRAELRDSVSQFGITWTFDKQYECGQFVNGDWWVVGPVTISSVSPAPRTAISTELNDLGTNRWGDTGLQDDTTMRNGSMVVMTPSSSQGYDSRGRTYNASLSIAFPYSLDTCQSLISSISNDTIPNQQMFHEIMWNTEKEGKQVMKTAAILTCLPSAPPADAFRPTYIGSDKRIFTFSQVQWDKLLNLEPTASMPPWSQIERYFERPWLDHMNGSWVGQWLLPIENQASYGREGVRMVSFASLMLHTDTTQDQKKKLLTELIQVGIDLRGIVEVGGRWNEGGGHTSGRKWPIIFAGLMLNDSSYFLDMPSTAIFHEDVQTYYGEGWAGQKALWQMIVHHGKRLPYMHVHPSLWSTYDDKWATRSEGYRVCCNAKVWPGQTLACLLMEGKSAWNHNAYFDVVEDWMRETDIYAANRDGYSRPSDEGASFVGFDDFITEMWRAYRDSVPSQPSGDLNLMWDASKSQWVENDTIPPGIPTNLDTAKTKTTSVSLSWTAPTDNVRVFGYNVYRNGKWYSLVYSPYVEITGLASSTEYSIIVKAMDDLGNLSEASDTLKITTKDKISGIAHVDGLNVDISVYPNPSSGNDLIVDLGANNYGKTIIEVVDLSGKILYKKTAIDNNRIIKMNDCSLKNGIYIIRINNSKKITSKKLIIT